eukprot:m.83462 g.83462  ORF g.83462 m.83462 type:complete len:113 (+) comp25634_c2_seq3:1968-2306(+)
MASQKGLIRAERCPESLCSMKDDPVAKTNRRNAATTCRLWSTGLCDNASIASSRCSSVRSANATRYGPTGITNAEPTTVESVDKMAFNLIRSGWFKTVVIAAIKLSYSPNIQ